jgi:ArsR family metal-binding transcriptional regulator
LKFEDEEEAISYADELEDMLNNAKDRDTPQYRAIGDIIMAIRNDEFIQSY